jgi:DNA-binding transcriptional LysR family regulator
VHTSHSTTAAALASEGVGVALVNPAALVGLDRRRVAVRPFDPAIYLRKHLVFAPGRARSSLQQGFVRALVETRNRFVLPLTERESENRSQGKLI